MTLTTKDLELIKGLLDPRFDQLEKRLGGMDTRISALRIEMTHEIDSLALTMEK